MFHMTSKRHWSDIWRAEFKNMNSLNFCFKKNWECEYKK